VQDIVKSDSLEEATLKVLQIFEDFIYKAIAAGIKIQDNRAACFVPGGVLANTDTKKYLKALDIGK
jgi:hypothetical protein